jgi:hypothetical protein
MIKFTSTKRYDSLNFSYAIDDFGRSISGLSPKNICLYSAHDNLVTYQLFDYWDINALIDININSRAKSSENAPDYSTFNKKGHPIRKAGHK